MCVCVCVCVCVSIIAKVDLKVFLRFLIVLLMAFPFMLDMESSAMLLSDNTKKKLISNKQATSLSNYPVESFIISL